MEPTDRLEIILFPICCRPKGASSRSAGKYDRMRRSFLKEHRPVLYTNLLTSGKLYDHLTEIDQTCKERMECICADMAKREGVTEK